jgi:hypothetical protein
MREAAEPCGQMGWGNSSVNEVRSPFLADSTRNMVAFFPV